MHQLHRRSCITAGLFVLFTLFTLTVKTVDVRPIGPAGSSVGFATVNGTVLEILGTHHFWYALTQGIGFLCIALAGCFGVLGLAQFLVRKSLLKVDGDILLLGAFYIAVICFYGLFEVLVINYRPTLVDGVLEASYPSSHTMLSICILSTVPPILSRLFRQQNSLMRLVKVLCVFLILLTIVGRLLSGYHWFTDIIGSLLLSSALVMLYYTAHTRLELWQKRYSLR